MITNYLRVKANPKPKTQNPKSNHVFCQLFTLRALITNPRLAAKRKMTANVQIYGMEVKMVKTSVPINIENDSEC